MVLLRHSLISGSELANTMQQSLIPPELVAAYRAAEYRVEACLAAFRFRVQVHSPELAVLLAQTQQRCAVFITAHNPFSEPQSSAENQTANARLRLRLVELTSYLYPAAGTDPRGKWPPEPGYLALGVPLPAARRIGREFRQNAIVWSGANAVPELVLLR